MASVSLVNAPHKSLHGLDVKPPSPDGHVHSPASSQGGADERAAQQAERLVTYSMAGEGDQAFNT